MGCGQLRSYGNKFRTFHPRYRKFESIPLRQPGVSFTYILEKSETPRGTWRSFCPNILMQSIHYRVADSGGLKISLSRSRSLSRSNTIALAHVNNLIVVTGEVATNNLSKPHIPDVCSAMKIRCTNLLGLFQQEGWKV
jgi:Domain of unknown function (DUF4411)